MASLAFCKVLPLLLLVSSAISVTADLKVGKGGGADARLEEFIAAIKSKDVDELLAFFLPNARVDPPGLAQIFGAGDELKVYLSNWVECPYNLTATVEDSLPLTTAGAKGSNKDSKQEHLIFTSGAINSTNGTEVVDSSKYILLWQYSAKKAGENSPGGQLLIKWLAWSSDTEEDSLSAAPGVDQELTEAAPTTALIEKAIAGKYDELNKSLLDKDENKFLSLLAPDIRFMLSGLPLIKGKGNETKALFNDLAKLHVITSSPLRELIVARGKKKYHAEGRKFKVKLFVLRESKVELIDADGKVIQSGNQIEVWEAPKHSSRKSLPAGWPLKEDLLWSYVYNGWYKPSGPAPAPAPEAELGELHLVQSQ